MAVTVTTAGRRGGLAVLHKYGKAFYSSIGEKGQKDVREKYPGMASEWGKRGGRPRKKSRPT